MLADRAESVVPPGPAQAGRERGEPGPGDGPGRPEAREADVGGRRPRVDLQDRRSTAIIEKEVDPDEPPEPGERDDGPDRDDGRLDGLGARIDLRRDQTSSIRDPALRI